jgi:GH15 family glucan-1,4-alpha-glucosidase
MGYKLLEDYGVIGNLETCPLVGADGSIDWCCFPHVESSSVFAALLDDEAGGRFAIRPNAYAESTQEYVARTNVLRTNFRTAAGAVTLTDFMPVVTGVYAAHTPSAIYRKVTCTEGEVEMAVAFDPRFDYARAQTTVERTGQGVVARGNGEQVYLWSPVSLRASEGTRERAEGSFSLSTDETAWFVLQYNDREPQESGDCEALLGETVDFWQDWTHQCLEESDCRFAGPHHDRAVRSGLVLRLLMNPQTHAIAAAPTTSLPEVLGGVRNWDYRYAWIRDAAYTIQALYELGHEREARNGFDWCLTMCHRDDPGEIGHPLYGLHTDAEMDEETLDHLSGYRDSAPVRVGNKAGDQRQLDVYGELITAIYTATNYGEAVREGEWEVLEAVIDYVCEIWDETDRGIWEVRDESTHVVHSKVLCWAALDRGIMMAEEGGFDAPLAEWRAVREEIRETVLERGFDESIGSFTQSFDGDTVDAAALRVGSVGFLPFDDERVQGTIDAVIERLATEEGLVRRYEGDDGLPGEEGAFVLCTCWLVECLALSGRVEEAHEIFENLLDHASPLGLFAEEIDPETGEQRGNFPQAFSHIGLVNSALYLNRAENGEPVEPTGAVPADRYRRS